MKAVSFVFTTSMVIFISGCFDGRKDLSFAEIPVVHLACNTAQGCQASMAGKIARLGLTSNSVTCAAYLSGIGPTEVFASRFDASNATTLALNGSWLEGYISSWIDNVGRAVGDLPRTNYKACTFIDSNNNGRWDVGEMMGEGMVTVGGSQAEITDWY